VPAHLAALLDDWRVHRTVEHAAAVAERTALLLAAFVPPAPDDDAAFHRAWLAAAGDVVTRGWAATTLAERLPGAQRAHQLAALAKRLEALVRGGDDPRSARGVAHAIARDPGVLSSRRVYAVALQVLVTSGDASTDELLAAIAAPTSRIGELRAALAASAADERLRRYHLAVRLQRVRVEPTDDIRALWRAVRADPSDTAARTVLGDALLAAGDPRGELFALQLATGGDVAERQRRVGTLLASYGDDWIGGLAAIATRVRFDRGVVAGVELGGGYGRPRNARALRGDPVVATIEEVMPGSFPAEAYLDLITSPAMTALRAIEVNDPSIVEALPSLRAPIRHLAVTHDRLLEQACAARPEVRSLATWTRALADLAGSALLARMTALTLGGPFREALALWQQLPGVVELTLAVNPRLELVPGESDQLVLRRERAGVTARALGPWVQWPLGETLRWVDGLTRVELERDDQLAQRIAGELAPRGIAVVRVDSTAHAHAFRV
jgi:thioredoxin-like negative regulator of GroEL